MWHHDMLLLLLTEKPSHGYELFERLSEFDCKPSDIGQKGNLYKYLSELEDLQLISSKWEQPKRGPGKKIYSVTIEGTNRIRELQRQLRMVHSRIDHLLHRVRDVLG